MLNMSGIVTIIKDSEDIHFILEKNKNTSDKDIILTKKGGIQSMIKILVL